MKILVFYQYFSTPKGSWGTRIYEFAKYWVEQGHDVEVITSIYSKSDLQAASFIEKQIHDGINVTVINVNIDNKKTLIRRLWSFLVYTLVGSYFALFRKPDLTIASSGPISVGVLGLISRYFRKSKFVFEVRDLWPDGAIELGVIRSKTVISFFKWFESRLYHYSDLIVCLSPGMRDYVVVNHSHSNTISITNSANLELFRKSIVKVNDDIFKRKYAIYTGNIGEVNNSFWLLNTCRELKRKGREDIAILLIGDGPLREELCTTAEKENLRSFEYRPLMPKVNLVTYVQHSLVSLVPLKGTRVLDTSSPNKFFESLAAGVPVIQNTNGWMKNYIEKNNIGFTFSPDDHRALSEKLIELADNEKDLAAIKSQAFICAERDFDQNVLAKKYLFHLSELFVK